MQRSETSINPRDAIATTGTLYSFIVLLCYIQTCVFVYILPSHEIITHAHFVQNELAAGFVIMTSTASSERAKEDNHVLSSSSNTIGEIEATDQIQRGGDLGQ